MSKPLEVLDEAVAEAHEAAVWYSERSERTALRFETALDAAIEKIQTYPERWPEYKMGTRYVQLKKFPYLVIYRETDEAIQIIAIAHAHRRTNYWSNRLR